MYKTLLNILYYKFVIIIYTHSCYSKPCKVHAKSLDVQDNEVIRYVKCISKNKKKERQVF